MSDLSVIDVSALVYVGNTSKHYCERTYYGYPVGGIHYLMRYVTTALIKRNGLVLCFDSPSFRVQIDNNYKSGRVKNASVISQIETVYEALSACGIKCEKYDTYEADDIIDWVCQANVGKYESIDIIGNDLDLCHSVQNGVRFVSVCSGTNIVHYGNFEYAIVQGKRIRFNTISAYKVFAGCSSDKIPSMRLRNGIGGYALYNEFLKYVDQKYPDAKYKLLVDYRLPVAFAVKSGLFEEDEQQDVLRRARLVYPAAPPEDVSIMTTFWSGVNKGKLCEFLSMYNDLDSLACITDRRPVLTDIQKNEIRRKAQSLHTGEYAADHNVEPVSKAKVSTLMLDAFTREF